MHHKYTYSAMSDAHGGYGWRGFKTWKKRSPGSERLEQGILVILRAGWPMALILAEVGPELILPAVDTVWPLLLAHQIGPSLPFAHLRVGNSASHQPTT